MAYVVFGLGGGGGGLPTACGSRGKVPVGFQGARPSTLRALSIIL